MKKTYSALTPVIAGAIGIIFLLGNAGGVALVQKADRTGSPLSSGPCQACHSSGNFNTSIDLKMLKDNQPITSYMPGEVYTMRVIVKANMNAQQYGFQAVALAGAGHAQAGTFQNPPTGVAIRTVNNRTYPEQQYPSLKDTFQVDWVAPAVGTGDVRVYAAGVATNANGNSNGDGAAFINTTLTEEGASSVQATRPDGWAILSHRPGVFVELQVPGSRSTITIYDLQGSIRSVQHLNGANQVRIDLGGLPAGCYLLAWEGQLARWTEKIVVP
ncbi:MAG: hypothetical protein H6568_08020 [Lewinellaceae bacterium]|nr:hypothetical protein [Saprospiraceae bacterium]MCB9312701.1 hypothetical protein [Lewinellaceae bacterium]HRW75957.1 hypothetical protein [Saprospiraceae bacterium]